MRPTPARVPVASTAVDESVTDSERNRAAETGPDRDEPQAIELPEREADASPSSVPADSSDRTKEMPAAARPTGSHAGLALGVIALVAAVALALWSNQRFARIESELARRLQEAEQRVAGFDVTLGQSRDQLRDLQSRNAVLEARLADTAALQAQVEKLFQERAEDSLDVSLAEAESGLALASQQLALGADTEPVLAALQNIDSRLSRQSDPRLGPVRAALARDIERLRVHPASDVGRLALRIDALLAALDPLPLLASVTERVPPGPVTNDLQAATAASSTQGAGQPLPQADASVLDRIGSLLGGFGAELRQLFRVRQVDKPDAILVAPDQAYFLRQNLRLMLLNARLALLSRNVAVYRADLERAQRWIHTYYDGEHRNVIAVQNQLRQMLEAQLNLEPPRIDDSMAAVRSARAAVR